MIERWHLFFLLFTSRVLWAGSFYVSPSGSVSGDGSYSRPWTFQFALNQPQKIQPGDTIYMRGGIYMNAFDAQTSFSCFTKGTNLAPIIFKKYNNERAIIDGDLVYSLYAGFGNCSYTWFWGLEVRNSFSKSRNQNIGGGVTCTAENMKFINMIIHDTGHGLDVWKTAKDTEVYGCVIFHIGNNLNNNGNLEGHGHGLYLQNDTFGIKRIHNNIIFSTYGNGIKIWQTTTTAALGNFDIQKNIVFNGGAASENLGGIGNNSRTHNFFVLSNGSNNPLVNTVIKHNYTYSGSNIPRPPVNAFGLNYGVRNFILDSNYLTCQTRLGFNNTPVFDASVKGNKIMGGIPPEYGYYLWGFSQLDYPMNDFYAVLPKDGLEYFVLPNKYEKDRWHLVIYNWEGAATVNLDVSAAGLVAGETYDLINVMDCFKDTLSLIYPIDNKVQIPMSGQTFMQPVGSTQIPASPFPGFGVFVLQKNSNLVLADQEAEPLLSQPFVRPNPTSGILELDNLKKVNVLDVIHSSGKIVFRYSPIEGIDKISFDLTGYPKGLYFLRIIVENRIIYKTVIFQ